MTSPPKFEIDISWRCQGIHASANFSLGQGVTAFIGPSGAGKTTIARIITGLSTPSSGKIQFGNDILFDASKAINKPTAKRSIGYVTQEPALFPTMSVERNILLAARIPKEELRRLYGVTDITALLSRVPHSLSGGEARRVAIVRALAAKPRLLILDEPMNGLDPKRRKGLLKLIRQLSYQTKTPTILITHQLEEMLLAADHAILVSSQNTPLSGSIEKVLSAPETADLLGIDDPGSILEATVSGHSDGLLQANIGAQTIWLNDDNEKIGDMLRLRILSRDVGLSAKHLDQVSMLNQLQAKIVDICEKEQDFILELLLTGSEQTLRARVTKKSASSMKLSKDKLLYALIKAVAVKEVTVN